MFDSQSHLQHAFEREKKTYVNIFNNKQTTKCQQLAMCET